MIQFENDAGKVQSEDILPLFSRFLTNYFTFIDKERRRKYLNFVLSEDCILKLRAKTVAMLMNSIKTACLEAKTIYFYLEEKTLELGVNAWKKLLSTGGVIPTIRDLLLESFAVILKHCTYGREVEKPNPLLVLKILTLFPTKKNTKHSVAIRSVNQNDNRDIDERNTTDLSLQYWLCNLGTGIEGYDSNWSANMGAACASSFVLGQLFKSETSAVNNGLLVTTSSKLERETGAAIAKLCSLGTAEDNGSKQSASSLLWPAIHRGLKGADSELLNASSEKSYQAMRSMILFEFACIERLVGGMGNGEALFLSSRLPNEERREVLSPPPQPIESILYVACKFLHNQIKNVTLLQIDENVTGDYSNSSRSGTTSILSTHFSQLIAQMMCLRFAFPSSIKISEFCDNVLTTSLDSLTTQQSMSSQELVKQSALIYATLSCWAEIKGSIGKYSDVCNLLLSTKFSGSNLPSKNVEQASRSIFQYTKWGALSLLIPKIDQRNQLLEKVCNMALDSVNATPADALLPLFDCCVSALKLYTQHDHKGVTVDLSSHVMDRMVRALFSVLNDTQHSLTRMQMLHQICIVLFRSPLLNWEYEESSCDTIQSAFQELMSNAGTKRPHIAKVVISRITAAWLDGLGKSAIPYRQDIVDLLVFKELRTEGGVASAYQDEQEELRMEESQETKGDLKLPEQTHELSVVRGFVLLFLSKLPDKLPDEVQEDLIHWIILNLFETICNKRGSQMSLMTGSVEYCRRMRAWQALCLLSRFVTSKIALKVCNHTFQCLGSNMHGQIRYFCEVFTIRCTKMHPKCFGERFVKEINRVDLSLQQVASLMIIGGNLIVGDASYSVPFLQSGINLHSILAGTIPWLSSTQGFSRAIAQLLVHELIPMVMDVTGSNEDDRNLWFLRSIYNFLDQNAEMKRLRKKQNKFFARYAIDSVCTPEGLLSIPVDNGDEANPPHMVDIIKRCLEEVYEEAHDLEAPMWKQVEAILTSKDSSDAKFYEKETSSKDDVEVTFQRKILPHDTLNLELEKSRELAARNGAGQKKRPLIVCAVLVDKAPNLAGLARTAEIFAADRLIVPDLNVKKMDNFKNISVGAGDWVEIEECKEKDLLNWLNQRKQEGYEIVGLEQTSSSKCITDYTFQENTVLLLGREKEGIPVEYLQAVDTCIEIPQLGIIRSLNVHVSGALAIWEYSRQRIL